MATGCRHCHWAVGAGPGNPGRGHLALCRVRGSFDAVLGRPGARAPAAVEFAPAHFWEQRPGAGLHSGAVRAGLGGWEYLKVSLVAALGLALSSTAMRCRSWVSAICCPYRQRVACSVLYLVVSGRGGHTHPGAVAVAGRSHRKCMPKAQSAHARRRSRSSVIRGHRAGWWLLLRPLLRWIAKMAA